jgi:hypothetical protein
MPELRSVAVELPYDKIREALKSGPKSTQQVLKAIPGEGFYRVQATLIQMESKGQVSRTFPRVGQQEWRLR